LVVLVVMSLAVAVAGITVVPAAPARAATAPDPAAQRQDVRKQKAAVAGQIDTLNASSNQVNQALDALSENVRGAQATIDRLRGQVVAADRVIVAPDTAASFQHARDTQAEVVAGSDSLSKLDRSLSAQIVAQQAALIAKVQQAAAANPPLSAGSESGSGSGSGGGSGGGGTIVAHGPLTTINGITVATSIAGQLADLMRAASAAGFTVGGGGYCDSASQIALRKANCGTSNYAI
jgi:hypothetical protein